MRYTKLILAVAAGLATFPASSNAANLIANGDFASLTNGLGQLITSAGSAVNGDTTATGWSVSGLSFVMHAADQLVWSQYAVGGSHLTFSLADRSNTNGSVSANHWNGAAANGGNFLALDGYYPGATGVASQTVSGLTVGQSYRLSFYYAFAQQYNYSGASPQYLAVSFGGAKLMTTPNYLLPSQGFSGWTLVTETVTATSASEVLSFAAHTQWAAYPPFALVSNVSLIAAPGPEAGVGLLSFAALASLAFMRRNSLRRAG